MTGSENETFAADDDEEVEDEEEGREGDDDAAAGEIAAGIDGSITSTTCL